jgi:hypothetical protein
VQAVGRDRDGVLMEALLHVRAGYLSVLEILRADSEPLLVMPRAEAFTIVPRP